MGLCRGPVRTFFDDCLVKRLAMPLIVFSETNAQHLGLGFNGRISLLLQSKRARRESKICTGGKDARIEMR